MVVDSRVATILGTRTKFKHRVSESSRFPKFDPLIWNNVKFDVTIDHQPSKRVLKHHSIHNRHGLLSVSIILDGGPLWSKNEVFRVVQGILGPLAPILSVGVKVVDKIDKGRQHRTPSVNVIQ